MNFGLFNSCGNRTRRCDALTRSPLLRCYKSSYGYQPTSFEAIVFENVKGLDELVLLSVPHLCRNMQSLSLC